MYWIYLVIFVLAVLVPDIVPHDSKIFFLGEEQLEEVLIFFLGLFGFLIFRWKERQSNLHLKEKIDIQREAHQISRNLNDTYSYIGETNRKLDIMKNMSMTFLDVSGLDAEKERKFFDTLMESIYVLVKSKKIAIRFINTETGKTEKEIKSKRSLFLRVNNEDIKKILDKKKSFEETSFHFIIISPKKIGNFVTAIIISKNNQQQKLEDPEILKALAAQALFIYHYSKENDKKARVA